jgi:hypothetical protein
LLRPVAAITLATVLVTGVIVIERTRHLPIRAASGESGLGPLPGSAVSDLESLQDEDELLSDFDLLDELAPDQSNSSSQN